MSSGADTLANALLDSLISGKSFEIPELNLSDGVFNQPGTTGPLYDNVSQISLEDLTTGVPGGTGVFDKLMSSISCHLKEEFKANRIAGAEYTKAYIGATSAALSTAVQFLLGKDQAYWQALLVQAQARTADVETTRARIELETARTVAVRSQYEAALAEANYALTKIKLATEDVTYNNLLKQGEGIDIANANLEIQGNTLTYTLEEMMPAQLAQLEAQTSHIGIQSSLVEAQTEHVEKQTLNVTQQTANLLLQGEGIDYTNDNILPKQADLLSEQIEVQRAQTMDTRTDGLTPIKGSIGKQKELYSQQITSYQRDAEIKATKLFTDSWITQKTIDEGLLAPTQFTNANLDEILTIIRENLGLTPAE